jgi:hypothetical protein
MAAYYIFGVTRLHPRGRLLKVYVHIHRAIDKRYLVVAIFSCSLFSTAAKQNKINNYASAYIFCPPKGGSWSKAIPTALL